MGKEISSQFVKILIILTLSACGNLSSQNMIVEEHASYTEITKVLQESVDCVRLNCWESIVPGLTTYDEARNLIEERYGQSNLTLAQGYIGWIDNESTIISGGSLSVNTQDIVNEIRVFLNDGNVNASKIIEWFGEPDIIYIGISFSSGSECAGSFIRYSDQGLDVTFYPEDGLVGISRTQFVQMLTFQPTGISEPFPVTDHWILEWTGYLDYCDLALED